MSDFLGGACLELAYALKAALGAQARLIDLVEPEDEGFYEHPGLPHHVLVEHQGLLYDATGVHTAGEVLDFWDARAPRHIDWRLEPHDRVRARETGLRRCPRLQRDAQLLAARIVG